MHFFADGRHPKIGGFTLVEILATIGIIAILGGAAVVTVEHVQESSRVTKLENDVATINSAINVYTVNGGTLPTNASPQEILNQLKTSADVATSSTISGLRGNMVDLRLTTEMQSSAEASGTQQRAVWNPATKRFAVTTTGTSGVKNFLLDDSQAPANPGTEARAPSVKADDGDWLWQYTDVAPTTAAGANFGPGGGTAPNAASPTAPGALQLNPPTFSQAGGSVPLINFDISLTLTDPNPAGTSQIYYSIGGAGASLYNGETIVTTPGMSVSAYASTSDPDHWYTSNTTTNTYQPIPVILSVSVDSPLSSLTYAQAGGSMSSGDTQTPSPSTITLNSTAQIPSAYLNSSKFQVYYTTDGSSPLSSGDSGPPFSGVYMSPSIAITPASWGTSSSLVIKAAARSLDATMFTSSPEATSTIGITATSLNAPTIDPPSGLKALDFPISIVMNTLAPYPVGARIYYTTDGTDPGNSNGNPVQGSLYTGQFVTSGSSSVVLITARAYGPSGYNQWFTPSPAAVATYSITTLAEGALVGGATLNGTFVGSLVYAMPTSGSMPNITFNSNARVLGGNIYFPGLPTIRRSNGTTWSLANDTLFASHIEGWEFDTEGNKTVQTTPRVLDETGSDTPVYTVTFNSSSLVEGKVIRRHTPPDFPTIPEPPSPDSSGTTSFSSAPGTAVDSSEYSSVTLNSGAGTVNFNPGNFSNVTANNGTGIILGDASNPDITQVYSFQSLTLNSSSDLQIVGKVIVTISGNLTINSGSVLGNSAHPEWFQLQFSSGNFTANSGSEAYGQLINPTGSVTFNSGSIFVGNVTAETLTVNSNSVIFNLPPIIQN